MAFGLAVAWLLISLLDYFLLRQKVGLLRQAETITGIVMGGTIFLYLTLGQINAVTIDHLGVRKRSGRFISFEDISFIKIISGRYGHLDIHSSNGATIAIPQTFSNFDQIVPLIKTRLPQVRVVDLLGKDIVT